MFYTIYKITNKINGKVYIGSHKTRNLDDNYMGSGKYLKRAIEKHGIENFQKEILFVFDNPEDMYAKEAEIVNEDFLAEANTYNLKVGGFGGWDYINSTGLNNSNHDDAPLKRSKTLKKYWDNIDKRAEQSSRIKEEHKTGKRVPVWNKDHMEKMAAAAQTTEAKAKRTNTRRKIKFQQSENNSQYGSKWIHNTTTGEIRKLMKNDVLPDGWQYGKISALEHTKRKIKVENKNSDRKINKELHEIEQIKKYREILDYYRDNDISIRALAKMFSVGVNMYIFFEKFFKEEYYEIVSNKKGNSNITKGRYNK